MAAVDTKSSRYRYDGFRRRARQELHMVPVLPIVPTQISQTEISIAF